MTPSEKNAILMRAKKIEARLDALEAKVFKAKKVVLKLKPESKAKK